MEHGNAFMVWPMAVCKRQHPTMEILTLGKKRIPIHRRQINKPAEISPSIRARFFPAPEVRQKVAHGETVGNNAKRELAPDGAKELFKRWKVFSAAPAGALKLFTDKPTVP